MNPVMPSGRHGRRFWFVSAALLLVVGAAGAIVTHLTLVRELHEGAAEHTDQADLKALVAAGQAGEAFEKAFEEGDELFDTKFNAIDGVGANVGRGQRFTRVPRADLIGTGEWARHTPARATGPNAQSCSACHRQPAEDGAGGIDGNVHRDPTHSGRLDRMIQRNTPHLFGIGAIQLLAEEMTADLHGIRDAARVQAMSSGQNVTMSLVTKGVSFGTITARPNQTFITSGVQGVDPDLVVKPFQWKGSVATVRDFVRGAANNELGMQAVELAGDNVDGDGDGVVNELTIGDITALTVYQAAQPRPTSTRELSVLNVLPSLPAEEIARIQRGEVVFGTIGCASCHKPSLTINIPIFREPSQNPNYRDALFPAGQNPAARGVDPAFPVTFDLTQDQPDNHLNGVPGVGQFNLGAFEKDAQGRAIVRLFGDLKRHNMGPGLAEQIDEVGTGAATFLTENLWGVGSTAPYMHDGRATTLTEAILEHGGEGAASRSAFEGLASADQKALIAFLNSLVLFKLEGGE